MPITIIPPVVVFLPAAPPVTALGVIPLPSIRNATDILIYSAGGGTSFPTFPHDLMLETGLFHGGNPLITEEFEIPAYDRLNITVEKRDVFSVEKEKGLFDIEYPLSGATDGNVSYIWNDVYTTPLGIYTKQGSVGTWNFTLVHEVLQFQTNDVNTIPRVDDYLVFNYVPIGFTAYTSGTLPQRLPYFKGTECYIAKVIDVTLVSGTGINVIYRLKLDKAFTFVNGDRFAFTLLNRNNTSIQKELFRETFEQIEIHRRQLLGDPYDNLAFTALPLGRMNYLNYNGVTSLGLRNLLNNIINGKDTPFVVFDANDDIQDRISFNGNVYDTNNKPTDIHFEFHLPYVMIDDNFIPATTSTVGSTGNVIENIFVVNHDTTTVINDSNVGRYNGLYLKNDSLFSKRYGWVFFDLRLVVIDHPELVTALGYNSNRNYTLPDPSFVPGSGNDLKNVGFGIKLDIVNVSSGTPAVVTTSTPYNLPTGTRMTISDVTGCPAVNGDWFITATYPVANPYMFELWSVMPTYTTIGSVTTRTGGIPVAPGGVFINNGVGSSGEVTEGSPQYSYFYTYRIRNLRNNSVMPYASVTPFNWATGGSVNNTSGGLYINIPKFNWYDQQPTLVGYDLGFEMLSSAAKYGIDVIVGEYVTDPTDPINPTAVIGIRNVMAVPLTSFTNAVNTTIYNPLNGFTLSVLKIQDYDLAVTNATTVGMPDFTFDLVSNMPLYTYSTGAMPSNLLTGNGLWTIGNFVYRNHVEMNRAKFSINVPANAWNDSTNPSYTPSTNSFITNKYITEAAILVDVDSVGNSDLGPMIYAKISPAVKKNQDLDLEIALVIDF